MTTTLLNILWHLIILFIPQNKYKDTNNVAGKTIEIIDTYVNPVIATMN